MKPPPEVPTTRRQSRRESDVAELAGYETGPDAPIRATATALSRAEDATSVVLVEGISDQIAIETLALRLGRNFAEDGVVVVPIGGAQAVEHNLRRFAQGSPLTITGLCDQGERDFYERAFNEHDLGGEGVGFFVCDADLEDELIRAIGPDALLAHLAHEGDLGAFRTMQKQPAWRERPFDEQMHRWIRSHARRSSRYAKLLVAEMPEARLPAPLLATVDCA